jgi:hypothetical protein
MTDLPQQNVAATAPPATRPDQLTQLGELRRTGVLTPEEFESEKARIMATPAATTPPAPMPAPVQPQWIGEPPPGSPGFSKRKRKRKAQLQPPVHDGLAVAALVLSLLWLGGLGSLLAVIFGWSSRREARRQSRRESGLAATGIILGYLGLVTVGLLILTTLG